MSTTQPTQNAGLSLLRQLPAKLAELLKQHFEQRLRINKEPRLSLGATTDQRAAAQQRIEQERTALDESSLNSIKQMRADASNHETAARSDIRRRLGRAEPADSAEAQVRESRETRAWARIKPVLDLSVADALPDGVREIALEALASNDDDALAALRTELPAYTRARASDRALADQVVPAVMTSLDQAIAQARPAIAGVMQELRELEKGMPRLLVGFSQAEHSIQSGELSVVVPSWDAKGEPIVVKADPIDHAA